MSWQKTPSFPHVFGGNPFLDGGMVLSLDSRLRGNDEQGEGKHNA